MIQEIALLQPSSHPPLESNVTKSSDLPLEEQLGALVSSVNDENNEEPFEDCLEYQMPQAGFVNSSTKESHAVVFRTSLNLESCQQFCQCQCHVRIWSSTPAWIRDFIGCLSFHGNVSIMLNRRPCNLRRCRQTGKTSLQLSYIAPGWLVRRALVIASRATRIFGTTSFFQIQIPQVIPSSSLVWSLIELGSLERLKDMARSRAISPYDISSIGQSLLNVRLNFRY